MRCFFSVFDPPAPVRYFIGYYIGGFLKSSQLVVSVRLVYCVNAARFLICCLSGTGRYRSIFWLLWPRFLSKFRLLERAAQIILAGDSHCFWFFSALSFSDKMMVSIHLIRLFDWSCVTLRGSSCSDFGHDFYVWVYIYLTARVSPDRALLILTNEI